MYNGTTRGYHIRKAVGFLILIFPVMLLGGYAGVLSLIIEDTVSFTYSAEPDPSEFIPVNFTLLRNAADYYDRRFEKYHIPLNFTVNTYFADTDPDSDEVIYYLFTDNGAQWTGLALTSFVFKYLYGKKTGDEEITGDALRVIRKLVDGFSMLLKVPNGGLGPGYSGIIARAWWGPEFDDPRFKGANPKFPDPIHYNGTGKYSMYRWRGFTSLDEISGFLGGITLTYLFVNDTEIRKLCSEMMEQVANYALLTGFLGIDGNGGPTGVRMKPLFFTGGTWQLLILKMGALANPSKYGDIYRRCAYSGLTAFMTREGGPQEIIANYYALAFSYHIVFTLIMAERYGPSPDPLLENIYIRMFSDGLGKITRTHRNPFFDVLRAIILGLNANSTEVKSAGDQLMRYLKAHFPDRDYPVGPIPSDYKPVDNINLTLEFLSTPLGALFRPYFSVELENYIYYNKPLTCEYIPGNIFIWEKNPFRDYTVGRSYDPRLEFAGFSFGLVFWTASAFGLFNNV